MSIKPEEKPRDDDDELDELPPIDGDGEAGDESEADEELDAEIDDGGDPMDDATGEDDPADELDGDDTETVETESSWLGDADEDDALDVGAPDVLGEEKESGALLEGAEETDVGVDDLTFGSEDESLVGDAGEEGFVEEEEVLREEDLPRLDSGGDAADADMDDADLGDALPDDDVAEEPLPAWEDRAWDRVEGAAGGGLSAPIAAVTAVACAGGAVIVGGEGVARVDAAGKVTALEALGLRGGAPSAIALDAGDAQVVVLSTPRAGVLVSRDGGKSFIEANEWRACVAREDGVREGTVSTLASLVMCGADLWGRTRTGAIVWSGDRGTTWARVNPALLVEAVAIDVVTGELVAIARGDAGACLEARGTAGRLAVTPCGPLPAGPIVALAANGGRVAVGLANRGAFRTNDAGGWSRLEGTATLTAMAYVRSGTLVVALCSEGEGRAWIVEARRSDGPPRIVAELGDAPGTHEDESDARVRALAWDESRGVMWAAGAFGLVALRPARR
jgi:hypothetical protein